ncbi:adenosylcobinamide-phosphate guanylyltransferase [Halobaculum gomorrense]|uniref:Adenosylcobinamide-phosphate guanylyltransferase n=2 Tax=Halobaculum gomorrense TaxID=43928 RepID=A0A1M5JDE7_9EURY|nr:adenosylcobinamide-phosphate guanylyltransferase [Halobaculum gomorrense]
MCGGRGTRLGAVGEAAEKPLVKVGGEPMVNRVLDALAASRADRAHAVVSPQAPATREHLRTRATGAAGHGGTGDSLAVVDAPGDGYVADLGYALERVDRPVLTVVADLPLLSAAAIDRVLGAAGDRAGAADASLAVYVPVDLKRGLGVSVDPETTTTVDGRPVAPTGLNVVGADDGSGDGPTDASLVLDTEPLAVNANRPRDCRVAEALLRRERGRDASDDPRGPTEQSNSTDTSP